MSDTRGRKQRLHRHIQPASFGPLFSGFFDARHNERCSPRAACGGAVLGIHRGGSGHAAISEPQNSSSLHSPLQLSASQGT